MSRDRKEYLREYKEKNKDKLKEARKKYYQKNKEAIRAKIVEYQKTSPSYQEYKKEYAKKFAETHKEELAEYNRRYYMTVLKDKRAKKRAEAQEKKLQEQELAHSLVSPSSLERVVNCTASVVLSKDLPDVESEVAKEGTEFHAHMEHLLKDPPETEADFVAYVNDIPNLEMAGYVNEAFNYISGIMGALSPIRVDIEAKLKAAYSDKDFGTLDFGMVYKFKDKTNILILDWKYGKGHFVKVEENKQLVSYALAYKRYVECENPDIKIDNITTVVYQPRLKSDDGKIARSTTYTPEKLELIGTSIAEKVREAYSLLTKGKREINTHTNAGEHCLFCKAKTTCKKYKEYMTKDVVELISDISEKKELKEVEFKDINTLTPNEILRVITFGETIMPKLKSYIEDVMSMMQVKLEAGETVEGLKLVQGRGRRKWIDDEEKIINTLENVGIVCTKPALKTLTEMTMACKSIGRPDLLDDLVVMSEGKPRVALESDKRTVIETCLITDL